MSAAKPDSAGVVVLPPVVFAFCLIAGLAATFAYGGGITIIPWPLRWAAGLLVMLTGCVFGAWGIDRFRRRKVDVRPNRPVSQLITGGAYRFTRNPMYVGLVAFLTGLGLFLGSIPLLLGAGVMFLYLDRYVIPREEAYLTRTFGENYRAYRAKVRRWV